MAELNIRTPLITDADIEQLLQSKSLGVLSLDGTKIFKEGAERLRKELRTCIVNH
ncbi:hypothetical protein [Haloferula sp.]|uniref:hypothetical protein n=1 Tax=Haloferula sp. TaxID=2497595 RepID=UPI003C744F7A